MEKGELSDFAPIRSGADRSFGIARGDGGAAARKRDSGKQQQPFSDAVIMCSKCCRKLEAGKTLRKAVKVAIRIAYGDAVQLEKAECFSLCPKGGQVLCTGVGENRRLVIVQPNSNIAMAVEYLLRNPD
jgi:hypothetical protein